VSRVCIGLVRGINVGGNKRVSMSDLRDLLEKIGFEGARSLLASGNLVFRSSSAAPGEKLEKRLEAEALRRLGLEADFVLRSPEEWKTVVARNPFPNEARRDPGRLLVMFLKAAPDAKLVRDLAGLIPGREIVRVDGRHAYIYYPDGAGRSKLTNVFLEKKLGTRGTARNWNTVRKIEILAAE
jgi:uncharacterized protein (DUF1697 family)